MISIVTCKHIEFVLVDQKPRTCVWSCRNRKMGNELGVVRWDSQWRKYGYFPTVQAVYDQQCLRDMAGFLDRVNAERHEKGKNG